MLTQPGTGSRTVGSERTVGTKPGYVSTSHLYERAEVDRAAPAESPWERTSAEERYEWWNADWGTGGDW